ncbi:collagenase [Myxococcus sp. MxC21-1]|uniref:collagenase n=1 Tax=Myxococcus sp. MxC21-1 TaxID=3041439 RepID=UPI0029314C3E|nr:collagenase [Myxococcus sp. MxC21-1]WNZ65969.1 collagenase [Myxococcus sp. MxC21-1]
MDAPHLQSAFSDTTWWLLGLAEYISKKRDNAGAGQVGRNKTYQLSEIFRNTLSSGSERVYSWGSLAARFMFERHASQVDTFVISERATTARIEMPSAPSGPRTTLSSISGSTALPPRATRAPAPTPLEPPLRGPASSVLGEGRRRGALSARVCPPFVRARTGRAPYFKASRPSSPKPSLAHGAGEW